MSHAGVALCAYKKGDFELSLRHINIAIDMELKNNSKAVTNNTIENSVLWFLRILTNLKLNNYEAVQQDYSFIYPFIKIKEGQQM